jgi:hypothetical protein
LRREPGSGRARRRSTPGETSETWQVARVLLRTWIAEEGAEPRRPWLTIVVSVPRGLVLGTELESEQPAPDRVLSVLAQTMVSPRVGRSGRPARVVCSEPELAEAIASGLERQGIACAFAETPELREAVASLEEHLQGERLLPGLLDTPGVTPQQVGHLFAAAADYYRAAPWRFVSDEHPIAVRFPAEGARARYAVVMGSGGIEFGLAVYRSLEHLAAAYSGIPAEVLVDAFDQEAITYGKVQDLPFSDLDALERYEWEVAGPNAYPLPLLFTRGRDVRRPSQEDLSWYEATLRAIPRFVTEYLRTASGRVRRAEATLQVPLGDGETAVYLRHPPDQRTRPLHRRRQT